MGPRPRIPELSGTPGLDPEEDRWSREQPVPPHSLERHAEDDERVEEGPRDPGDHRHDRRFGHRGPHQRGPPREPPRVRRDEGPGHARRALDRDAPGVLEVLEQCFMDGPNPVRPLFVLEWITLVRPADAICRLLAGALYDGNFFGPQPIKTINKRVYEVVQRPDLLLDWLQLC